MVIAYHGVVLVHQQLSRLLQQSHMEKIPASKGVHTNLKLFHWLKSETDSTLSVTLFDSVHKSRI